MHCMCCWGGHVLAEHFFSVFDVSCVLHPLLKPVSPDVTANKKVSPTSLEAEVWGAPSLVGTIVSGGMKFKSYLLNDSEVICAIFEYFSFT